MAKETTLAFSIGRQRSAKRTWITRPRIVENHVEGDQRDANTEADLAHQRQVDSIGPGG